MAKKKRRIVEEPEEEYEFTPTEFNEREYVLKNMYQTKVFMICMAFGLIIGIIGAFLSVYVAGYGWIIATVLSFAVMFLLKKILSIIGIRVDMLESKGMIVNYFMYLAMGLVVCIILVNIL